ncbi:MAG: T9SS type A sorting domain-containing protein [Ignavibacteriae bacterium]|nr:T9SS type A sorting domain-containing protein [Ignavibacteriota bacterium]
MKRHALVLLLLAFHYTPELHAQDPIAEWQRPFSSRLLPSNSIPVATFVDSHGNTYVTGRSQGADTQMDYLTVKYDFKGREVWSARFDGPTHGTDAPAALAVDKNGNVYVTGSCSAGGLGTDIATIKYSSTGDEVWVHRYSGSANMSDYGVAIACDNIGNVFVTGVASKKNPPGAYATRIITFKLGEDGVEHWLRFYNDSEYSQASGLCIDSVGNLYIVGTYLKRLALNSFLQCLVTLKYDSQGELLWSAGYDPGDGTLAEGKDIAVDKQGRVTITGEVSRDPSFPLYRQLFAFVVINYDSNGNQQWADTFGGSGERMRCRPTAMSVDPLGNIYISAIAAQHDMTLLFGEELLTVKYTPAGAREWTAHFNHGYQSIYAGATAIDHDGGILVGGLLQNSKEPFSIKKVTDYAFVLKLSSSGGREWVKTFEAKYSSHIPFPTFSMSLGSRLSIAFPTGTIDSTTFTTLAFDEVENLHWRKNKYGESKSDEAAYLLELDRLENVYVCGMSKGSGTSFDILTMKYDLRGNLLWTARYDGPTHRGDAPTAIVVDSAGDLVIAGISYDDGRPRPVILKYTAHGRLEWVNRLSGLSNVQRVFIDPMGNIILSVDESIVKYDTHGQEIWRVDQRSYAIGVDRNSNLYYIAKGIWNPNISTPDTLFKRGPNLESHWTRVLTSDVNEVRLDDQGSVYLFGYAGQDIKIDTAGNNLWSMSSAGYDHKIDSRGNIFEHGSNMRFRKIRSNGTLAWEGAYAGLDVVFDYQPGRNGNITAIGMKGSTYPGTPTISSLDSNGVMQWWIPLDEGTNPLKESFGVRTAEDGSVYAIANGQRDDFSTYPVLLKYKPEPQTAESNRSKLPSVVTLSEAYPNPFNPTTAIRFTFHRSQLTILRVYDLLGREIATLVNEVLTAGHHSATWDASHVASGIYICRLESGSAVLSMRLMVVK